MRTVSAERLGQVLGALPGTPRVVAGGNFATPWQALAVLDAAVAEQIITQVAHPRVRGELREAGRALGFRV